MPSTTSNFNNLPPYPLSHVPVRKRELLARGVDVIDLGAGDADLPAPDSAITALAEAARQPAMSRYGFGLGLMAYREAIAAWMEKRFQLRFDPLNEVVPLIGSKEGIAHIAFAYLSRGAFQMGHNAVGVTAGGKTAWVHFAGTAPGRVAPMLFGGPGKGYVITELTVTAQQAGRASRAMQTLRAAAPRPWGLFGPNCTTVATRVLQEAGVVVPAWSQTPFLLHLGVTAGAEITVMAGTAATVSPWLVPTSSTAQPVPVMRPR